MGECTGIIDKIGMRPRETAWNRTEGRVRKIGRGAGKEDNRRGELKIVYVG